MIRYRPTQLSQFKVSLPSGLFDTLRQVDIVEVRRVPLYIGYRLLPGYSLESNVNFDGCSMYYYKPSIIRLCSACAVCVSPQSQLEYFLGLFEKQF